jgi:ABC-2 type transport system permease protein
MNRFSFVRLFAVLIKESLQMRRDRGTVGLTVMLPLVQLFLFGYAINANPRHLPTGLLAAEHSTYERTLAAALQNTGYFDIQPMASEDEAEQALARGDVMFVLNIPPDFSRRVDRGEQPQVLMDADATDPTAIANATAAVVALNATVLNRDLPADKRVNPSQPPFQIVLHGRYNPEQLTALNIVPGLIGLILTVSTLVMTTLAITRERESGTMENLLATPVRPVEVMLGKIIPYVGLAYVQIALILLVSVTVRCGARFRCCCSLSACSSRATWRWGSHSRRWRRRRCRRNNCPSSGCCRRSCYPASCSRSWACRPGPASSARRCR